MLIGFLVFTVWAGTVDIYGWLKNLWSSPPAPVLTLRPESKEYEARQFNILPLKMEVVLDSAQPMLVDDLVVSLGFFKRQKNDFESISEAEVRHYFIVEGSPTKVLPLDSKTGKVTFDVKLGCIVAGSYKVQLLVESKKQNLKAQTQIAVEVRSPLNEGAVLEGLVAMSDKNAPTFVVKGDTIDTRPNKISDWNEFKVIFPDEAKLTNLVKATLWFRWHHPKEFAMAAESSLDIFRDPDTGEQIQTAPINPYIDPYVAKILRRVLDFSTLEVIGTVGNVIPVGTSFYKIDWLDEQRLRAEKVSLSHCKQLRAKRVRLLTGSDPKFRGTHREAEWEVPQQNLRFITGGGYGATGRYGFKLEIGQRTYSYTDDPVGRANDFPVVLITGSRQFLRIDIAEHDPVAPLDIRECPQYLK